MKYTETSTTKKWKFTDEKFWYFSYFCSKHRLWVLSTHSKKNKNWQKMQTQISMVYNDYIDYSKFYKT